ncbi:hypothetical protein B9Z19DRAFT_1093736 [Tuber borchii]|uniref:LYR motif-containing protein 2 n=1 Tax=Tuber borchii TaxID=42251 RepID=A0A2T6ZF10_TUBBO|nr:hypothetical protein B9Z19DRAFT_1093736 [Tuber borchii]
MKMEIPSLKLFLQRMRVLSLYRDALRSIRCDILIENPAAKSEMRSWARQEFERNRHVEDLAHIRYLISNGKKDLETMTRYTIQKP